MLFSRWKRILTVEIDQTHEYLPPAEIRAFHPLHYPEYQLQKHRHLACTAVLALKNPQPMLIWYWTEKNIIEMAAYIVNLENLDPAQTIFVFDCTKIFRMEFRQLVFEWEHLSTEKSLEGSRWSAKKILRKIRFKKSDIDAFCEGEQNLFKLLWKTQSAKKVTPKLPKFKY